MEQNYFKLNRGQTVRADTAVNHEHNQTIRSHSQHELLILLNQIEQISVTSKKQVEQKNCGKTLPQLKTNVKIQWHLASKSPSYNRQ